MTLTQSPLYPAVDEAVTIVSSTATGDVQVLAVTSTPSGSTYSTGLVLDETDDPPTSALRAAELGLNSASMTFDEPGEYGVSAYDVAKLPGLRNNSNGGTELRYVVNRSDAGIIHVGAVLDLPIRTIGDGRGATLRLQINDTKVRAASFVDPTDEAARVSALAAAPVAAIAALVGLVSSVMGNDLVTGTNDLLANHELHRVVTPAVHPAADTTNVADRTACTSKEGAYNILNQLRVVMTTHQQTTPAAAAWHNAEDWKNVPVAAVANSTASATVLLADLRERVYERHRTLGAASTPPCHAAADAANSLTAATQLDTAITAYLDALVLANPPALVGEPEGAHDAANNFGFAIQDS